MTLAPKTPFEYTGGDLSLDFANTVDNRTSYHAQELLTDYSRLLQWAEESGALPGKTVNHLRSAAHAHDSHAQSVLRNALRLRDAIYDTFAAVVKGHTIPSDSLAAINHAAQRAAQHAQVVRANSHFVWEWISPEDSFDSMLWPVARAAAELLTSTEVDLVRQCASDTCAWLFVDRTKNHRRRWCEMKTCGNREKARRYYHRQKSE
jgi:predicted RNA-binding Zn ribbon-like protein